MAKKQEETPKRVRVTVTFPARYYAMLEELETQSGSTKAEVIRDALAFQNWMREVQREGGKILVRRKNGELAEVVKP